MKLSLNVSPLLRSFPVPSFLKMSAPGIEISSQSVTFFSSREEKGVMVPKVFDHVTLQTACILATAEDTADCEELATVLTKLAEKHSITSANVAIPEEDVFVFSTMLYLEDGQAVDTALVSQIEKNVPFSPDDISYDYQIIKQQGRAVLISVAAASKKTIRMYEEILTSAGITPLRMMSENQAMTNALLSQDNSDPHIIVYVGKDRAVFSICEGGVVELTSSIVFDRPFEGEVNKDNVFITTIQKKISQILMHWYGTKGKKQKTKIHYLMMYSFDVQINHDIMVYMKKYFPHLMFYTGNPWVNMFDVEEYLPEITKDQSFLFVKAIGASLVGQHI